MAHVLWRLLPLLVVLLAVLRGNLLLVALRWLAHAATRLLHVFVLVSGAGVFWWMLRSYQLSHEQEIYEAVLLKHKFYERYRRSKPVAAASAATVDTGDATTQQLKVAKRLPIHTHLRTAWNLAPEICEEIATFVNFAVRDYVHYWFQPISMNEEFPQDIKFLLADIMGALVARVLEIDSSQALTMAAKSIELLRLHLGWFRETFAQLAEEHPAVFQGEESDANLLRRQKLVASYVQKARFLHPGCVNPPSTSGASGKKTVSISDTPEAIYLRHVATQLLIQLKPELGQQSSTNLFVSIAMNLMRESLAFKALKPVFEYAQPRYANEVVIASLQSVEADSPPLSPMPSPTASPGVSALASANSPTLELPNGLKSIRITTSFLYRASKRSSEQAEAALQAVFDVVSSAASTAASTAASGITSMGGFPTSPTSTLDGADYWSEAVAGLEISSPRSPMMAGILPQSPPPLASSIASAPSSMGSEKKLGHFSSIFSLDDRISFPKTVRIIPPRAPSSVGTSSGSEASGTTHMDDLKNMKANLESSLKSSLFRVNKTFKNLGGHLQEPFQTPLSVPSAAQATSLMKRPGKLFQKALRRSDPAVDTASPVVVGEFPPTPPPLPSTPRTSDAVQTMLRSPTQPLPSPVTAAEPETPTRKANTENQDRVLAMLGKAIANYVKMHNERPEMRSSARSRELYELLSALEDLFILGYRKPGEMTDADDSIIDSLPPLLDPSQLYWNYLAQDRPETPFLTQQWQFIEEKCPVCSDSELFYSTRGIQWILIALEKGLLWEYTTALNLNRKLTELFYDDSAVLRHGKLMEKVLKSLFQLNKIRVMLEIPSLLGRSNELEKELGHGFRASNTVVLVVETAWEVERYVPLQGWIKSQDKRTKELPSSEWIWENEWTLEASSSSTSGSSSRDPQALRRSGSDPSSPDTENQSWEYGKISLDHRFHDKEKKLDSVRRRKWTRRRRQLPLVLSVAGANASGSMSLTLPSKPLDTSSVGSGRDSLTSSAVGTPTKKRSKARAMLTKRRSLSLDKSSTASELTESVSSPKPRLSGGLRWRRTKQNSSSPLKRTTSAHDGTQGSLSASGDVEASLDIDGIVFVASEGEEDDDGEEAVVMEEECFRCVQSLTKEDQSFVCQSCSQRVCGACHQFFAFLVYPPPLESTKKEQVCGHCYDRYVSRYKVRVEAHVSKYFIKEKEKDRDKEAGTASSTGSSETSGASLAASLGSPTSSTSVSSSGDADGSTHRFEVTVQMRDESPYAWPVVKTFQDFETLEKHLQEKLKKQEKKHGAGPSCRWRHWKGVDYSEILSIQPSIKAFSSASLSYDKKLRVLESYLHRVIACDSLGQSSVLHKFLLLAEHRGSLTTGSFAPLPISHVMDVGGAVAPPSSSSSASPTVLVENGKWKRGKWIAPETNTKETKIKVLQQLEVALFAVLNEVFEFDGIGIVRRHLFSMTRSFIKAFLSASHFRKLEKQYLSFTDPKKMAASLLQFRLYMFPDAPVPPPPTQLTPAEMRALRKQSLDAILASFPSTIVSVFGETSSTNAALKLHEFLQHEVFVKNLLFSICDELLPHVFPDVVPFTHKVPSTASGSANTSGKPTKKT